MSVKDDAGGGHRTIKIKSIYLGLIILIDMHKSPQHDAVRPALVGLVSGSVPFARPIY